ncbi:nucleoside diphosphate kinase regulator [Propionivibrio sp.]|uniref:nucleoside diphosphate kinase regulator n=1 Tax=Propionivibrio sp. TaxID=2212460 RepID=UPI0039E35FC3
MTAPSETLSPLGVFVLDVDYLRLRELPMSDALDGELDRATIVPRERFPENVVAMHTRCVYLDESTGERREVELVYPDEADPAQGRISVLAPVGCALLGLTVGSAIDWGFPGGKVRRLRLERILAASSD